MLDVEQELSLEF
jgi:hypothetical protein